MTTDAWGVLTCSEFSPLLYVFYFRLVPMHFHCSPVSFQYQNFKFLHSKQCRVFAICQWIILLFPLCVIVFSQVPCSRNPYLSINSIHFLQIPSFLPSSVEFRNMPADSFSSSTSGYRIFVASFFSHSIIVNHSSALLSNSLLAESGSVACQWCCSNQHT
jgi:hypothetical protein